jgi:hypothetical protein
VTALPDVRSARWAALTALVTTSVLLTACGSSGGDSGSGTGQPKSGGTLTFAVGSDAGCVDPQQVGPCAAVVAVVGYYVPLLGIPLAGFLAVDMVLGWVTRRRTGHAHA